MRDIATSRLGDKPIGKDFLMGDPVDPARPEGQRGPAAAGRMIDDLRIAVKPGDPVYENMKREVSK